MVSRALGLDEKSVEKELENVDDARRDAERAFDTYQSKANEIIDELESEVAAKAAEITDRDERITELEARIAELETYRKGPRPAHIRGLRGDPQ